MSAVDSRVVELEFDNKAFGAGVKTTLDQLSALQKALQLDGATKGLEGVDAATKKVDFTPMADNAEKSGWRINAMSIAVGTAIATLSRQVFIAGENLVKSVTTDPLKAGLDSYAEQIDATQIILANTKAAGTNLSDVTSTLADLQRYANQTVYSFSDMTTNIGRFTAAGVGLKPAQEAIKGMANVAALSGANTQQMSSAMYQMSQALSTGTLRLQDWNSLANANMGGQNIQKALEETARTMGDHGKAMDAAIKKQGNFRESLQEGWLTADIYSKAMGVFGGTVDQATGKFRAYTVEELKAKGYTEEAAKSLNQLSQDALNSAVNIRTIPQLMAALHEEVAGAWGSVFKVVFGDINQATELFSNIHNVAENALTGPVYKLRDLLQGWSDLGGRAIAIDAFTLAFQALGAVIKPIKEAFHEIFPAATAKDLLNFTKSFHVFTENLLISGTAANNIKRTFAGVFALFHIGWQIFEQLVWVIGALFGHLTKGSSGILKFTGNIGDFIVALDKALERGTFLNNFFVGLENWLEKPITLLRKVIGFFAHLFEGLNTTNATKAVGQLTASLHPLGVLGHIIAVVWGKVVGVFDNIVKALAPLGLRLGTMFHSLGMSISDSLSTLDFSKVLAVIKAGLLGGFLLTFRQLVGVIKGFGRKKEAGGGLFDGIKESFEQLTSTLKSMQQTLKAATLLQIAFALGILTISVIELSRIDANGLKRALTAMTVMFLQLAAAMAVMQKITAGKGFAREALSLIFLAAAIDILASAVAKMAAIPATSMIKGLLGVTVLIRAVVTATKGMDSQKGGMITTATGLVIMASAIRILVTAVSELGGMSWKELVKGLGAVGAILAALTLFTKFAEADGAGIIQGTGIILLAVGIRILTGAVADLGKISWHQLVKGLGAMGVALGEMAVALRLIPASAVLQAAGILVVATSLGIIADAMAKMGAIPATQIIKGLIGLGGALGIIALALTLMPPSTILSAAAVLVVAASLGMITDALGTMGDMTKRQIAKSLIELAGALGIIALAVNLMDGALPGAAALLVVSASLLILEPILMAFSNMSWSQIIAGLTMLAGVFVIIGLAGLALAPVVLPLLGLGAAILLLGVAVLAAGAGILMFATALTVLAAAGAAGTAAIVAIVSGLLGLLPEVARELGLAVIAFAQVIATAGPAILGAISAVLSSLLLAIIQNAPLFGQAFLVILQTVLTVLVNAIPMLVDAGLRLLIGFLQGIANNIGAVINAATNVVVGFLNGVANNLGRIIQSGVNLILAFLNGVADAIRNNGKAFGDAAWNIGTAIIDGIVGGLRAFGGHIWDALKGLATGALDKVKGLLGIHSPSRVFAEIGGYMAEGMAIGIDGGTDMVHASATNLGSTAINAMSKSIAGLGDLINSNVETNPTITPVLDLSGVQKDAANLSSMLTPQPLSVDASVSNAVNASAGYSANQVAAAEAAGAQQFVQNNTFNQTNNSPKALSSADIYRQTKNQISVAKGVLANA